MKISIERNGYRIEFVQQKDPFAFLVKEFSGTQEKPINTYAISRSSLLEEMSHAIRSDNE